MQPKLSFIIPMYNAGLYIGTCIDSILAQNFDDEDFEIIVIDDGSVDNSKVIAQSYSKVKYYYKDNGGQSTARNMGIEKAMGNYLCFVDADDYLIGDSLPKVLEMAQRNDLDMACYDIAQPDKIDTIGIPFIESKILCGGDYIANNEYYNGPYWYLIKSTFVKNSNLKFIEGRYVEDAMFTMQALLMADKVQSCNQKCYCYVRNPNSTLTKKDSTHLKKVMDDYLFASCYMRDLAVEYKERIPIAAFERLNYRSESFLFFLLVRLLRYPNAGNLIDDTIRHMKDEGVYPIRRPNPIYYTGIKYSVITFVVNNVLLLKACNWLLSFRHLLAFDNIRR